MPMLNKKPLFYFVMASLMFVTGCTNPAAEPKPYGDDAITAPDPQNPKNDTNAYSPTSTTPITPPTSTKPNTTTMEQPQTKQYTAILQTTQGDIEITLNSGQTPNTVKNFIDLSNKKFYNNTVFHRVIKGFMIQGGDPKGDGTGGPGYKFADEPFTGEYTRGTVAMANSGPNTNGSQFFIMHADYPLPKNYVIFGHVTKGIEVVDKIANSPVTMSDSGEESKPVTVTKIETIDVKEK